MGPFHHVISRASVGYVRPMWDSIGIGAPLARIELRAVFSQLPARFPAMRLTVPAGQLPRRSGALTGGLTTLPVEW
jgi:cytochrome P450